MWQRLTGHLAMVQQATAERSTTYTGCPEAIIGRLLSTTMKYRHIQLLTVSERALILVNTFTFQALFMSTIGHTGWKAG